MLGAFLHTEECRQGEAGQNCDDRDDEIAMTAMTINNSINVNAEEVIIFFIGIGVASARVIAVLPEEVNKYF